MDVQRTLARFPPNISDKERCTLQEDLTPLIVKILWSCPRFHYYQGNGNHLQKVLLNKSLYEKLFHIEKVF